MSYREPIRRFVTGHNDKGEAVIVNETPVQHTQILEDGTTFAVRIVTRVTRSSTLILTYVS